MKTLLAKGLHGQRAHESFRRHAKAESFFELRIVFNQFLIHFGRSKSFHRVWEQYLCSEVRGDIFLHELLVKLFHPSNINCLVEVIQDNDTYDSRQIAGCSWHCDGFCPSVWCSRGTVGVTVEMFWCSFVIGIDVRHTVLLRHYFYRRHLQGLHCRAAAVAYWLSSENCVGLLKLPKPFFRPYHLIPVYDAGLFL